MLTLKPTNLPSSPTDDYEVFDESRTVAARNMLTRAASKIDLGSGRYFAITARNRKPTKAILRR